MIVVHPLYVGFHLPLMLEYLEGLFYSLKIKKIITKSPFLRPDGFDQLIKELSELIQSEVILSKDEEGGEKEGEKEEEEEEEVYLFCTTLPFNLIRNFIASFYETRPLLLQEGVKLLTIRDGETIFRFFSDNVGIMMEGSNYGVALIHLYREKDQRTKELDQLIFRGVKAAAGLPYSSDAVRHLGSLIVPQKEKEPPDPTHRN